MRISASLAALVLCAACSSSSKKMAMEHCTDASCHYLGDLIDLTGSVEDGKSQAATLVDGHVSLDSAGGLLDLAFTASGATLSAGDTGAIGIQFDDTQPKSSSLVGDALTLSFGVQVSSNLVTGTQPDTLFCAGGDLAGNGCATDADCDDGSCLAAGTCSCDSDFMVPATTGCTGSATGGKGDDGSLRTNFSIDCDASATGFSHLKVTVPLFAGGTQPVDQTSSALRSALGGPDGGTALPCSPLLQCDQKRFCVQPILIANDDGSMPTACPSFDEARNIFGHCCVAFDVQCSITINATRFKVLDVNANGSVTQAELDLTGSPPAGMPRGCFPVYCVDSFDVNGGKPNKDLQGGGKTLRLLTTVRGKQTSVSVFTEIIDDAYPGVLAHEMGHALGLDHSLNPTIMTPTGRHDVSPPTDVLLTQCQATNRSPRVITGQQRGCCKTPSDVPP